MQQLLLLLNQPSSDTQLQLTILDTMLRINYEANDHVLLSKLGKCIFFICKRSVFSLLLQEYSMKFLGVLSVLQQMSSGNISRWHVAHRPAVTTTAATVTQGK